MKTERESPHYLKLQGIENLVREFTARYKGGTVSPGTMLEIQVVRPYELLDLFYLGRFLAFLHHISDPGGPHCLKIGLRFGKKDLHNLHDLGLFKYCDAHGFQHDVVPSESQLLLRSTFPRILSDPFTHFAGAEEAEHMSVAPQFGKTYRLTLAPLQMWPFPAPSGGQEIARTVNTITLDLAKQIRENLPHSVPERTLEIELSHIIFRLIKELVANVVTHSHSSKLVFAMTMFREVSTDTHRHRQGFPVPAGQDTYDILLMDLGRGVLRSVREILTEGQQNQSPATIPDDYFSLAPWSSERHGLTRSRESSFIQNVFEGTLVIRKGRKSDGLHELADAVRWFAGQMKFYTGRTELTLSAAEGADWALRHYREPFFLPGVIVSALLPSHQTKVASLNTGQISGDTDRSFVSIERFSSLPKAFLGGNSILKIRRRSELDVEFLATQDQCRVGKNSVIWEIDLKLSPNIDVDYIDGFIQELSRSQHSQLIRRLVFTNVPRNVIHTLKRRSCHSILMLREQFLLLLDEADSPHFLGLPRTTRRVFDIEDCIYTIYNVGSLEVAQIQRLLSVDRSMLDHLKRLFDDGPDSIFFSSGEGASERFHAANVKAGLDRRRRDRLGELSRYALGCASAKGKAVFRLHNGRYFDHVFDFSEFWSDVDRLFDCARLIHSSDRFRTTDTVLAFISNGEALARCLQQLNRTPNLVIVDPHRRESWDTLALEGDCALVLDTLYPGDEVAYVGPFIQRMDELSMVKESGFKLVRVVTLYDFRSPRPDRLSGVLVVSVDLPDKVKLPTEQKLSPDDEILQGFPPYRFVPHRIPSPPDDAANDTRMSPRMHEWKPYRYSPIELSSEFWHNVSELRIIDSERRGREERSILFFENNERLIRNPRMRRFVGEFVEGFVKNVLDLDVDVILHPAHAVGHILAEMVASQLTQAPLILPLTQRSYGQSIELAPEDYRAYRKSIEELQGERSRQELSTLVLDDSVLSGSSLFTMLGIAARLGLKAAGILVLLNRLTPEVSQSLSLLPLRFSYLYRLHMPVLKEDQSPDAELLRQNKTVLEKSNSHFARRWATSLSKESEHGSHFRSLVEPDGSRKPPSIAPGRLEPFEADHIEAYRLRQILSHLILHPSGEILSFGTRVAVAYNFLEGLVRERAFWHLLEGLAEFGFQETDASDSLPFVRAIIYILAFSKHVYWQPVASEFRRLCSKITELSVQGESWIEHASLLADCFTGLAVSGDEELLSIGAKALKCVLGWVLESQNGNATTPPAPSVPEDQRRTAARTIVESLAWSVRVLVEKKGSTMVDTGAAQRFVTALDAPSRSTEEKLVIIDVIEPAIAWLDPDLIEKHLAIAPWSNSDHFLERLSIKDNGMLEYLKTGPGYTCTLKSLLFVSKADTVLLYAGNINDPGYFVRAFETKRSKSPMDDLQPEDLRQDKLPADAAVLNVRMDQALFCCRTRPEEAAFLDKFHNGVRHGWFIGGAVNVTEGGLKYYVVLGYRAESVDERFRTSAYYYWLRYERFLRTILPEIHGKHVVSSTAWNAHIQTIRPLHIRSIEGESRPPRCVAQRALAHEALGMIDLGSLLRRAVRMDNAPPVRLRDVRSAVGRAANTLRNHMQLIQRTRPAGIEDKDSVLKKWINEWPVRVNVPQRLVAREESIYAAVNITVLEFILYEMLYNALTNHDREIEIDVAFVADDDKVQIRVDVRNDVITGATPARASGIKACRAAASAVNGTFESQPEAETARWCASLAFPAQRLPESLCKELANEYL